MRGDSKRHRILHLIASNFYGGPEKQIVEHLKRLEKDEFIGIVASFLEGSQGNEITEHAKLDGVENYTIPMNFPLDVVALIKLKRLCRIKRISLLCTHGYKSTVMGWVVSKTLKLPMVAFSRGYTAENLKVAFYEWIERFILKRQNAIISVSNGQKRKLEGYGIRARNHWVVHNAITAFSLSSGINANYKEQFFKKYNIPPDTQLVVTAGRLSPEKGHRYLLEAVKILKSQLTNLCFLFAGDGSQCTRLKKKAKRLEIFSNCRFLGFRKDLHQIFEIMDLFVLPSLTEGLPNVILEAFAEKKPVVATDVGGVPELVTDRVNGFLVPPAQPRPLADKIKLLLESAELRKEMGNQGFRKINEEFTFEQQERKLVNIYCHLLHLPNISSSEKFSIANESEAFSGRLEKEYII